MELEKKMLTQGYLSVAYLNLSIPTKKLASIKIFKLVA